MKLTTTLVAGLLAICIPASADLLYTFNTDVEGFQNAAWSATGPAGWAGGAAIRAVNTNGGWTLGSGGGPMKEFSWSAGGGVPVQQLEMQALAASGNGHFAFDLMLDGTSFPQVGTWYSINIAGNSGVGGWKQIEKLTGDAWHNAGDNALLTYHFDYTFAQLGWTGTADWYQIFFGANSDPDKPIGFYIDNVRAYVVPEPATLALAGLAAALLIFRRR